VRKALPWGRAERRHLHAAVEQLYFVLEGTATVRLDDREEVLRPGDAVHVPATTPTRCATTPRERWSSS
jgi:mannose-6-phosphate isomerase-like protein (cupin superfamily)